MKMHLEQRMNDTRSAVRAALARRRGWLPAHLQPTQLLVLSFVIVIAIGTVLLSLPAAVHRGPPLGVVDALFTATSATCVTGLAVVDTGTRFSLFGQIVILCCIQIGGLGLMTFTTVFLVALGRRLSIADRIVIQESLHHSPTGAITPLIIYVVLGTFAIELLGAVFLTARWWTSGAIPNLPEAAYSGIFHAISAFCNAGFSIYADSLVSYQRDP
jgi:trk system potassium uptake protein TrkH